MDSPRDEMHCDIVCTTTGSAFFDEVIGHIEDIVLSDDFENMQETFLEKHWQEFDDNEENKLVYMDIFEEYTNKFESYFMTKIQERMQDFDMEKFAEELKSYNATEDSCDSEIFELLQSFNNFQTFKELMLDYRSKKEGHMKNLEFDILVTTPLRLC